jgi:hypothetical protein
LKPTFAAEAPTTLASEAGNQIASDCFVLHKTSKVTGFHIHALDGGIGHVDDFLWLGGKSVLISTTMVTGVDSPAKRIDVNLTKEQIVHGPSIDEADIELVETLPPFLIF